MTLKFSRNAKVTRSLIGRLPVRPLADDEFERMTLIRQILLEILNNENIRPTYLRCYSSQEDLFFSFLYFCIFVFCIISSLIIFPPCFLITFINYIVD